MYLLYQYYFFLGGAFFQINDFGNISLVHLKIDLGYGQN